MHDEPRQKLRDFITDYGHSLCDGQRRCEALRKDYGGQYKLKKMTRIRRARSS